VLLPLLKIVRSDINIVPIAVSEQSATKLRLAALNLAEVIHRFQEANPGQELCIVVSSDMSHYISQEQAKTWMAWPWTPC
jgi:Predicted dioxygenase